MQKVQTVQDVQGVRAAARSAMGALQTGILFADLPLGESGVSPRQRWKENMEHNFEERKGIKQDFDLHEIPGPKLITRRTTAFVVDGLLVATISLWLGGGFWWLIAIGYVLVRDVLINGSSIGKFVVGLTVTDRDGNACTLAKSIVRNLLLLLPGLVVEFFVMAFSRRGWRLGDRLAKTQVAHIRPPMIMGVLFLVLASSFMILDMTHMTQQWDWREWLDLLGSKRVDIGAIITASSPGTKSDGGTVDVQTRDSLEERERYIIYFRNRQTIAVEEYWERGDEIHYQRLGGIVGVRRNRVAMIENKVDGTKKQYNPFLPK
ncbi:MAG TPA: RDD family protein [Candidatus Methylomirabilis sp.]|nr:RDD family protein [Candidatus Methylomirabilis sp.]